MNRIYIRRCRKAYIKEGEERVPPSALGALQKNISTLGFVFSETLIERVGTLSQDRLAVFYRETVKALQEMVGAHREFKPMYPNFPAQVMEATEARLFLTAITHYITNKLPAFEKTERDPLLDEGPLRIIDLGSKGDFELIFTRLTGSKATLSAEDKEDIEWFVTQYRDDLGRLLPPDIPVKETLAVVGALLLKDTDLGETYLANKVKTATDVLRLAVAMNGGDVSLAEPTKFGSFSRRQRKWMMERLNTSANPTEDMLRRPEQWKRLGERLHPGDYQEEFSKAFSAFDVIRNKKPYVTFNQKVEQHLLDHDVGGVLDMIGSRGGDLARRLDHLLRLGQDREKVFAVFRGVIESVSTRLLLQVFTHFTHRNETQPLRIFFPKGDVAKVFATEKRLPALDANSAKTIAKICEEQLLARFGKLPPLGKCYVDPELVNYLAPFSQRSASKALRTLVRGSRLPLPKGEFLRFFIWWKNGSSRTDIDLSAAMYGPSFNFQHAITYYNLKALGGYHSGDIVDAPNGAAEIIDIDIKRTISGGGRFVVMSINSFTEQPYCDLPECFAGWMSRTNANSGEVFEARTVRDRVDIASNTRICIPAIFDLVEGKVIWADIALRNGPSWNNVKTNLSGLSVMTRAMTSLVKLNLHTLFMLHARARGVLVNDRSEAETVFAVNEGITPFDLTRISADFL